MRAQRTRPRALFRDRRDAGRALAERLAPLAAERPVVLGLPRGGIPVAYEVARALGAPLDVLVARKIGAPGNPEFGMGAAAEGGVHVLDRGTVRSLMVGAEELAEAVARADAEVAERVRRSRADRPAPELAGRTVLVVDDGLATGGTARAALRAARARHPRRLVLAVPVGPPATLAALAAEADEIVCLAQPEPMMAVGAWYERFGQTSDDEVIALLAGAASEARPPLPDPPAAGAPARHVEIPAGPALEGDLTVVEGATGLVLFAHGSGSSRRSPRNREVAAALQEAGLATLLFDLLTAEEERDRAFVFDVELLAGRLVAATRWAQGRSELRGLPLGYFGASTGAAAALWAAAELPGAVTAVVSRGGRPDLAAPRLAEVRAAVLLIVGGRDELVLQLNREALSELRCPAELEVVPGATHLFEEPGALPHVSALAARWFAAHLRQRAAPARSSGARHAAE